VSHHPCDAIPHHRRPGLCSGRIHGQRRAHLCCS
jgi:hypothetical protein